jgi:hypothetical protein
LFRFVPNLAPRGVGALPFLAAGLSGGVVLSLVVVPALRLTPRKSIGFAIALVGAALGYVEGILEITLGDDVRLRQPLPAIVGFLLWQSGVAGIIGRGLKHDDTTS